jgi:hypothetical protein
MQALLAERLAGHLKGAANAASLAEDLRIVAVSEHCLDGNNVRNRQYVMFARLCHDATDGRDFEITLNVALGPDANQSAITATISQWNMAMQMPGRANQNQCDQSLKAHLDPLLGVPLAVLPVPPGVCGQIIAAKVMSDGDFKLFVTPPA